MIIKFSFTACIITDILFIVHAWKTLREKVLQVNTWIAHTTHSLTCDKTDKGKQQNSWNKPRFTQSCRNTYSTTTWNKKTTRLWQRALGWRYHLKYSRIYIVQVYKMRTIGIFWWWHIAGFQQAQIKSSCVTSKYTCTALQIDFHVDLILLFQYSAQYNGIFSRTEYTARSTFWPLIIARIYCCSTTFTALDILRTMKSESTFDGGDFVFRSVTVCRWLSQKKKTM